MEKPHYGAQTHSYCPTCKRRIFARSARRTLNRGGKHVVELACPIHGRFVVTEDLLNDLSGSF